MGRTQCIRTVIASDQPSHEAAIVESGRAEIVAHAKRGQLAETVCRHRPEALLVDLGDDGARTLDEIEALPGPRPALLVCGPDDSELILRALRLGAREYVAPGDAEAEQIVRVLVRLQDETRGTAPDEATRRAPLVAVLGAKGGVGATFVSCQLAVGLARDGRRVGLIDLQTRAGDVALYLDLRPAHTLASLATKPDSVDADYLRGVLHAHGSGVRVLAAPQLPEEAELVERRHVERAIDLMRSDFDYLVVDTPRDFGECSLQVLDQADAILLVTSADIASLHHTRRQLDLLQRIGTLRQRIHVVANRTGRRAPVGTGQMREFLGCELGAEIPNDYPIASGCVNEGRSAWEVARRSALTKALDRLGRDTRAWIEGDPGGSAGTHGVLGLMWRRRHGTA